VWLYLAILTICLPPIRALAKAGNAHCDHEDSRRGSSD